MSEEFRLRIESMQLQLVELQRSNEERRLRVLEKLERLLDRLETQA
jgi:hypothetical protein